MLLDMMVKSYGHILCEVIRCAFSYRQTIPAVSHLGAVLYGPYERVPAALRCF